MKILLTILLVLIILSLFLFKQKDKSNNYELSVAKVIDTSEVISNIDYNIILDNNVVEDVPIEVLEIGNLNTPSGEIVVCDPLVFFGAKPFVRRINPGIFPIKLYVAKTKESGDRHALAKLEITENKAVKWILAITESQNIDELKEDEYYGFPVDAGLGSFLDNQTAIAYEKFCRDFHKKNPDKNMYDDFFASEFKKNARNQNDPNDIGDWLNYTLPNTKLNITMFSSGYGDGYYPAYWGIDKNGEISSLVIDFFVLLNDDN